MIWVLAGITVIAIFVGILASEIMDLKTDRAPEVKGVKVGVLENRIFESYIIAQHGGILQEMEFNNTVQGIFDLIEELKNKRIGGFLVTRPTYYYYSRVIVEEPKYATKAPSDVELKKTELHFREEHLVAGILVKQHDDYSFFKTYFESNWASIQACQHYNLNSKEMKFSTTTVRPMKALFIPFFTGSIIFVGGVLGFGLLYEIKRKKTFIMRAARAALETALPFGTATANNNAI